jgi:hypothetical protein
MSRHSMIAEGRARLAMIQAAGDCCPECDHAGPHQPHLDPDAITCSRCAHVFESHASFARKLEAMTT